MEERSRPPSRRRFLTKAFAVASALAAKPARARPSDPERERLVRLLAKYGSELGGLRKVEGRE